MHNFNLKLLCYWAAGSLLIDSSRLSAQGPCTVGVNQPAKVLESGNYKAFPKSGVRVWQGAWLTNSNGIRYVYCDAGPSPANCPAQGGGDFNFTGTQKSAMDLAFSNWTSAMTPNGSSLPFSRIYTSIYGSQPFAINVLRMGAAAMGIYSGLVVTFGWNPVDSNYDGLFNEGSRLVDAIIEIRSDVPLAATTPLMAHEVGHTMGLDNCFSCQPVTVMAQPTSTASPTAPSACDNDQVRTMMF